MLSKIALAFAMLGMLILSGCQNFGTITPEKAIVRGIAANNVVAQCYADYIREVDVLNADVILHDNGLKTESEYIADVPLPSAVTK